MRSVPSRDPGQRLQDIIENIEAARDFLSGMSLEAFTTDRKTYYAVLRALEIISEASRRLPDDLKARHPTINWQAVAAAGNVYRHEYEAVMPAVVWHTVTQELRPLEAIARQELAR